MEIATGYFISRAPAIEAARELGRNGCRIEVLGHQNQEDFRERQVANDQDDSLEAPYYGFTNENTGIASGINGFMLAGTGPLIPARPIVGLGSGGIGDDFRAVMINWGVPRSIENEIKSVIDSGSSVVLVEYDSKDKHEVSKTLQKHGAQNIHI